MVSNDRQQVIETNRSLRTIKNELEALLEKGVISEGAFDSIHNLLPAEGTLSNTHVPRATAAATPSNTMPPSYAQSTSNNFAPPPPLPQRKQSAPEPTRPVIARCKALYDYEGENDGDLGFKKGDRVEVWQKVNADWWYGRIANSGSEKGREGLFPANYVEEDRTAVNNSSWANEKVASSNNGYPPPPANVNPYNSSAPPMAMANTGYGGQGAGGGEEKPSKTEENTKKFGKKLGNAAIFGAGATLGGKIVNSIF